MNKSSTMMAAVCYGPGDLRLEERPLPVLQEPADAIVKVTLSTICTSDLHILHGAVPRAIPGTVLGHEFVGQVVETGPRCANPFPWRPGGRQLHHFLRAMLVLPARVHQQLPAGGLGAWLPDRRLPGGICAGPLRGPGAYPHPLFPNR